MVNQTDYQMEILNRAADLEFDRAIFLMRPSIMLRARVYPDGNAWCALYGTNIQEGVCGFGDTPDEACKAFDAEWYKAKAGTVRS